jgi:alpha-ketoglutarate-dependent taurine dioxygenase
VKTFSQPHHALGWSRDEHGVIPVVVASLPAFLEAADRHPRSLVVLRASTPPSSAELRRYCLALGGIRQFEQASEVRTLRYDPSIPDSTAMSLNALPLHTDGSFLMRPPTRFVLSFSAADPGGGGVSIFMPITRILAALPDWALTALLTADYLFVRSYDGDLTDSYVGPVLYREDSVLRIRWRSDDLWRPKVVQPRGTEAEAAIEWLHDFLYDCEPFGYAAQAGETLLVPNTVMLHGRTSLSPGSSREVLRAWVD